MECRICLQSEGELFCFCNCKSAGEHQSCLQQKIQYMGPVCEICNQPYVVTYKVQLFRLLRALWQKPRPLIVSLLLGKLLRLLYNQLDPQTAGWFVDWQQEQSHILTNMALAFVLVLVKAKMDFSLCKQSWEKPIVLLMSLLGLPCFLVLELLEVLLQRDLPYLHVGFILLFSQYDINKALCWLPQPLKKQNHI